MQKKYLKIGGKSLNGKGKDSNYVIFKQKGARNALSCV